LLRAWEKLSVGDSGVELHVFGSVELPATLLRAAPASITFHGPVSRKTLAAWYKRASLLVFPTLLDGFGLVITEALSAGLPVITTRRAGAADFVTDGETGFVIQEADVDAIVETLDWCASHRSQLEEMGHRCVEKARSWQWIDYRRELATRIVSALNSVG
jgi:glycosyltransferase involved in cell wall biosynthesis